MTEPTDQPAPPLRTWRPMVLWTAAILLALGLAWFIGTVLIPFYRVREVIELPGPRLRNSARDIARLGGPTRALPALTLYYRLPRRLAPDKCGAVVLLGACGEAAVPVLREALRDENVHVRLWAVRGLSENADPGIRREVVNALREAVKDQDPDARLQTAHAFTVIRPLDAETIALAVQLLGNDAAGVQACIKAGWDYALFRNNLEEALASADERVRSAAAEALKKIKGQEPPK